MGDVIVWAFAGAMVAVLGYGLVGSLRARRRRSSWPASMAAAAEAFGLTHHEGRTARGHEARGTHGELELEFAVEMVEASAMSRDHSNQRNPYMHLVARAPAFGLCNLSARDDGIRERSGAPAIPAMDRESAYDDEFDQRVQMRDVPPPLLSALRDDPLLRAAVLELLDRGFHLREGAARLRSTRFCDSADAFMELARSFVATAERLRSAAAGRPSR